MSSVIKVRRLSEEKAAMSDKTDCDWEKELYLPEFVGFTESEHDIFELHHRALCGVIHELQRTLVVWLGKTMLVREPMERVAV